MLRTYLDHLVVMAPDLASGVSWCERTLGVSPGAGGEHPLMGTHNRLLKISAPGFEDAYLEIIALNPGAVPQLAEGRKRWFDFDDAALQQSIHRNGAQLVHWVARTPALDAARDAWQAIGIERGPGVRASRDTPQGRLEWQITVRDDGARLFEGCLPTLIQWGAVHPVQSMAPSGVLLESVKVFHPQAQRLQEAFGAVGISQLSVVEGAARLQATLVTPLGRVTL